MTGVVLGWDIGGANIKAARVDGGTATAALTRPFEVQRHAGALVRVLAEMGAELSGGRGSLVRAHAVTMTAELSQLFRTKADGVAFVLDAVAAAFPGAAARVYAVDGRFLPPGEAVREPLAVAASNWSATAALVSREHADCLLIDVGTTTADVIPIAGGRLAARGATDPERLLHGELVYTGAVRTPVEAIVRAVPLWGGMARVSAEAFALAGDAHVWRGALGPAAYDAPTPDGRPTTRLYAGERLARVVCADRTMLSDDAIGAIAESVAVAQVAAIADAAREVCARHSAIRTAAITGVGEFLAAAAARSLGLHVRLLSHALGASAARAAPAAAVALLLAERLSQSQPAARPRPATWQGVAR